MVGGRYKGPESPYKYEVELRLQGYVKTGLCFELNDLQLTPNDFEPYRPVGKDKMDNRNGKLWRKAIRKYLSDKGRMKEDDDYKIVVGVGYWRDLHDRVYEVWKKEVK